MNCFCTCWIVVHAYTSLDVILLLVPGSVAVMTKAYPSIERNDLILVQEIASYMLLAHGAVYVILVREFWMFICVDILYNWLNSSEILAIKSYRTFMHKFSHLLFGNLSQLLTNHTCSQLHSNMNELNVCSTRSDFSNTFLNSIMIIHEVWEVSIRAKFECAQSALSK